MNKKTRLRKTKIKEEWRQDQELNVKFNFLLWVAGLLLVFLAISLFRAGLKKPQEEEFSFSKKAPMVNNEKFSDIPLRQEFNLSDNAGAAFTGGDEGDFSDSPINFDDAPDYSDSGDGGGDVVYEETGE